MFQLENVPLPDLNYSISTISSVAAGLTFLLYLISKLTYDLYFHPLAKFPGPKVWAISRLPYMRAMQNGDLVRRITEIHSQYGSTVRIAPNELSFIDPAACRDIHIAGAGQPRFAKNPVWLGKPIPRRSSIFGANDEDHVRLRRVWGRAFTERAVKEQEPLLQFYVGKFVEKLRLQQGQGQDAGMNLVQWFDYLFFDLTGDLVFGESFGCLDGQVLHPWISIVFSEFQTLTLLASTRFYPRLRKLLVRSTQADALRKQQKHRKMTKDKIQRRLNLENERPDFLQRVLDCNHAKDAGDTNYLDDEEVENTASTMIVAGSETTSTLLAAIVNVLINNPDQMDNLVREIRTSYDSEQDMSLASLAELPYLGAVIQETLRIAPPVPFGLPRVVPAGGAKVGGHWLPENTFVSYANFAANHSSANFSDPESFIPARWLSSTSPLQNHNPGALQQFSMGPRNCLGQRLAWAEARLTLARLLWNFDVVAASSDRNDRGEGLVADWARQKAYVVWQKEALWIRLKAVRSGN